MAPGIPIGRNQRQQIDLLAPGDCQQIVYGRRESRTERIVAQVYVLLDLFGIGSFLKLFDVCFEVSA